MKPWWKGVIPSKCKRFAKGNCCDPDRMNIPGYIGDIEQYEEGASCALKLR